MGSIWTMESAKVCVQATPTNYYYYTELPRTYIDINECEEDLPCDDDVEICSNLIGSFKCKCKPGLVRVDEVCVEEITKEKEPKKKKKKKNTIKKGIGSHDNERIEFPWYHILAPLMLAIVTYKYSQPTVMTSTIMILLLVVTALHY